MAGFNPCYCWNLKDGCVTVGIWSLVYSIIQMAIFGWQTAIIKFERDKTANRRLPAYWGYSIYDNRMGGGDWTNYYVTPEEKFYTGLFVVQILNLIAAFFLLFASVALIYGVHTSSKYLVWPWFPCIASAIICSLAYCVMWWVGNVTSYWLVLTVVEVLSVLINIYCLLCVIVQYKRIIRGYVPAYEDDGKPQQQLIGYEYPYRNGDTGVVDVYGQTYPSEKKSGGVWNAVYEQDHSPKSRVQVYGKDANGRHTELPPYTAEGGGVVEQLPSKVPPVTSAAPQRETEFPASKSDFTEEWIKNVMSSHPEEPKTPVIEQPPSPGKDRKHYSRSRSLDALEKEHRREKERRGMRCSKSKDSVASSRKGDRKHRRSSSSCSTCSSSSGDESTKKKADDRRRRSRSQGHNRRRDGSDSEDTGFSQSVDSERKRDKNNRHHHHHNGHHRHRRHHRERSDGEKSRKRMRDVKREDRERRQQQDQPQQQQPYLPQGPALVRPETSSTDRSRPPVAGGVPVFPFAPGATGAGGAAISIPQHIVIPPQPKGAPNQPQRFHINSEITISYSDKSAPGSDSEHQRAVSASALPAVTAASSPQPPVALVNASTSTTAARRPSPPIPRPRNANGHGSAASSSDSKGYGSTAV